MFARQTAEDFLVLNADDARVQQAASRAASQVFWFSRTKLVRQGACVHKGVVVFRGSESASLEPILPVEAIPLKGAHNVENVLAAVCAARLAGVEAEVIARRCGASAPWSTGWSLSPQCAASTTTTTPKRPTSIPP